MVASLHENAEGGLSGFGIVDLESAQEGPADVSERCVPGGTIRPIPCSWNSAEPTTRSLKFGPGLYQQHFQIPAVARPGNRQRSIAILSAKVYIRACGQQH